MYPQCLRTNPDCARHPKLPSPARSAYDHRPFTAGLQYGISRRGFSELTNVVVFDMGAAKTEVGVFTFHPKEVNASKDNLGAAYPQCHYPLPPSTAPSPELVLTRPTVLEQRRGNLGPCS